MSGITTLTDSAAILVEVASQKLIDGSSVNMRNNKETVYCTANSEVTTNMAASYAKMMNTASPRNTFKSQHNRQANALTFNLLVCGSYFYILGGILFHSFLSVPRPNLCSSQ